MGAYVSKDTCYAEYNIDINCILTQDNATGHLVIGGYHWGEFPGDPDIAGIGVFYVFFSIAAFALLMSIVYLALQLLKYVPFTGLHAIHRIQEHEKEKDTISRRVAWSDVIEGIILSCSDQQIFATGAYAITLRYAQGCKTSAYHYNIIGNMMIMTCATHLMSVTVVSQYWKHWVLALMRILLVTGLYTVTGLILANQNVGQVLQFPTEVPKWDEADSPMILNAACFQADSAGALNATLRDSFKDSNAFFKNTLLQSSPKNKIVGWNFFILMILWYGLAIIAEVFRFWYHRRSRAVDHTRGQRQGLAKWVYWVFWGYQSAGAVFCTVATGFSFNYIRKLRSWMNHSEWIEPNPDGRNPEEVATTFGQLVPILLTLLTVFTFLQLIGDKFSERRHRGKAIDAGTAQPAALTSEAGPGALYSPLPDKKTNFTVTTASVPNTPSLQIDEPQLYPSSLMQKNSPPPASNFSSSSSTAFNSLLPVFPCVGTPHTPQNNSSGRSSY